MKAIEILKLNTIAIPNSGNAVDSLGEAYLEAGNKELAIENYKKSLVLDPGNENGRDVLKNSRPSRPDHPNRTKPSYPSEQNRF